MNRFLCTMLATCLVFVVSHAFGQTAYKTTVSIAVPTIAAKSISDAPFDVVGTASNGAAVLLTSTTKTKCTVAGITVTPVSAGDCVLLARTPLDAKYSAGQTPLTIKIVAAVTIPPVVSGAPIVLYTDITSGPNTGGENNKGVYLSVFGKNFGSLASNAKVFIGGVEVDNYRYFGKSRARADIQQITVQVGALGSPVAGVPLPIKVTAGTATSNADKTFTVTPGNIYFVDPKSGVDTTDTTTGGTFTAPFKTVQKPGGVGTSFRITSAADGGVWGRVRAGDFIILRGGSYTDIGFGGSGGQGYFLQALNKSGCPVGTNCPQGGGASSGPITIMGYPGETAFVDRTNALANNNFGGGISSADSARQAAGYGAWFTIANLKIESGFTDGPVNIQKGDTNPLGANWRVVNNELTAYSCATSTLCRAGAIAGGGTGNYWVGNYGHDVYDQPDVSTSLENHGIYIGGGGSFEIAYNVFEKILGGNGIQVQSFNSVVKTLKIHHNIIRDVGKHGLNFTDGSGAGIEVWNNIVQDTDYAGVRTSDDAMRGLKLYNNTFYNIGRLGNTRSGAMLVNDTNAAAGMFEIRNNIFWANAKTIYNNGCCNSDFAGGALIASNNLWFGAGAVPAFDSTSKSGDPLFVTAGGNFRLTAGSPAINAGKSCPADDYDVASRSTCDIGGFAK